MKPVIGVIPLWDDERESLWMLPGYFDGIRAAGGLPFMLPLTTVKEELAQLFELCDGLLLTGGHDVSPQLYGEEPIEELGVNSYHHQAVKALAPGLEVMAEAEDGLIEAVRAVDKRYIWVVQWHPEFSYKTDINSLKILQSFVDAAK